MNLKQAFLISLCFSVLLITGCKRPSSNEDLHGGQPKLPTRALRIDGHALTAEIADTPQAMTLGLMFRKSLGENEGMLFIFSKPKRTSFWMRHTLIPLSIAYIDASGKILEIHGMQPLNEAQIASESDQILFALEVNQGWFAKRGIAAGAKIEGLP